MKLTSMLKYAMTTFSPIQLANWTLNDNTGVHEFIFPSFRLHVGQICQVYTNEDHPKWCGFNPGSGNAIWNNTGGDCGTLRNSSDALIDQYCY